MNRKLTFPAFALALMVGFSGCDLEVTNPNEPDRARALAGPDDVETLISSAYQQIWGIQHHWRTANFALNHMSSRHAASWGNTFSYTHHRAHETVLDVVCRRRG